MLSKSQDAYGRQLYDYFKGRNQGLEIVERDDGFIHGTLGPRTYLSQYKDWSSHEREAMRYATGRILDIGCGGGRHSLYLQQKGLWVLGVDISPLAIRVCRLRGLNARGRLITQPGPRIGKFDTVLMLGNGFGLFGNASRARMLLKKLLRITSSNAKDPRRESRPTQDEEPVSSPIPHVQQEEKKNAGPGEN